MLQHDGGFCLNQLIMEATQTRHKHTVQLSDLLEYNRTEVLVGDHSVPDEWKEIRMTTTIGGFRGKAYTTFEIFTQDGLKYGSDDLIWIVEKYNEI